MIVYFDSYCLSCKNVPLVGVKQVVNVVLSERDCFFLSGTLCNYKR